MNYKDRILEVDYLLQSLKNYKKELKACQKLSEKCYGMDMYNTTPKALQKANTALNWQCMNLDKQHKQTWKDMLVLEIDLEDCEYRPSGFHTYKHSVK